MRQTNSVFAFLFLLVCGSVTLARAEKLDSAVLVAHANVTAPPQDAGNGVILEAPREKQAMQILLRSVQAQITSAAEAMPAVKYGFAPTEGEFKGVRTFGAQIRHLAACNHILAAAALGEDPPADAGDEQGPDAVRSKSELLEYLHSSFEHLGKAIDAIGDESVPVIPNFASARLEDDSHGAHRRNIDSFL